MYHSESMIFSGLSPNSTGKDVLTSLAWLLLPWKWRKWYSDSNVKKSEHWLENYLSTPKVHVVDSGSTALFLGLRACGVQAGDEVIVQGYTCIVVANAITRIGATPIYVDIDPKTYNIDPSLIEKALSKRTKAIIVQHTFGNPAKMNIIVPIAKKHHLYVIEDCAHALGALSMGKPLGTSGDIGIFSFGSEKIISSVRGGAIAFNNSLLIAATSTWKIGSMPAIRIVQHLLSIPLLQIGKKTYQFGVGIIILWLSKKLHLISRIVTPEEKRGSVLLWTPSSLPEPLAAILLNQLRNFNSNIKHRRKLNDTYAAALGKDKEQSYLLSYPLKIGDPYGLSHYLKKHGVSVDLAWTGSSIVPRDASLSAALYITGSCPNAENVSKKIINLPMHPHITQTKAHYITSLIQQYEHTSHR